MPDEHDKAETELRDAWGKLIDAMDDAHRKIIAELRETRCRVRDPRLFDVGVGADKNRADNNKVQAEKKSVERAAEKAGQAGKTAGEGKTMKAVKEYAEALDALPP